MVDSALLSAENTMIIAMRNTDFRETGSRFHSRAGAAVLRACFMVLLTAIGGAAFAIDDTPPVGQSSEKMFFLDPEIDHLNYLLFIPSEYYQNPAKEWPLILFLHGSEERGDDPDLVKKEGLPELIDKDASFPFIVVSPQCPQNMLWSPTLVKRLLDVIEGTLRIDGDRIYLTGFSMGGSGTWKTAIQYPDIFAAIAPICGYSDVPRANGLKDVPVWAFHGAKDRNIPLSETTDMVEAVRSSGGNVRLTIYPDLAHDCWTTTYGNPELYRWFLSYQKGDGSEPGQGGTATSATWSSVGPG
jgi:predicted peptidase